MIYLSIIFLLLDVLFASIKKKSLVTCVSECWYHIKWAHYALLYLAALMMLPMLDYTPDNWQFLAFFACAALLFVATAPSYLEKFEGRVHSASAILCAACAIAWAVAVVPVALIGCVLLIVAAFDKTHRLLWLELSAFATAYIGVILLK